MATTTALDFFDLQDDVFELTERVSQLCGYLAYRRTMNPKPLSMADSVDDLLIIKGKAERELQKYAALFDLRKEVTELAEKVRRLCGDLAYGRVIYPNHHSLVDNEKDLLTIKAKAMNELRLRRNAMARNRRRAKRPAQRGSWTHKTVFTRFLQEYGTRAKEQDAWRHFLADEEIIKCDQCGMYEGMQDGRYHPLAEGGDIWHFCTTACARDFVLSSSDSDLKDFDQDVVDNLR